MRNLNLLGLVLAIFAMSCSNNVKLKFDKPDDEIAMMCEFGKLGKVPVVCGDYSEAIAGKKFSKSALVVVIEVGTFAANRGLGSENPFSAMLKSGELASYTDLHPHIRPLLHNLLLAFLEKTLSAEVVKYDQVYIAHLPDSQSNGLKKKFMNALTVATKVHPQVDMMLVGHAVAGEILLTPHLAKNDPSVNLTAQQLVDLTTKNLTLVERKKVRAIFQTYCFVTKRNSSASAGHVASLFEAYGKSFPNAEFYGSPGVNTMPLHRDFVMFEKYHATGNYKLAHRFAVRTMLTTPHDGQDRSRIVFPSLRIKGCVDLFFGDKCENRTVSTGIVGSRDSIEGLIRNSMPMYGNSAIAEAL